MFRSLLLALTGTVGIILRQHHQLPIAKHGTTMIRGYNKMNLLSIALASSDDRVEKLLQSIVNLNLLRFEI